MKKLMTGLFALCAALAFSVSVIAKTETIVGKVVDEGCSMEAKPDAAHGAGHGAEHKAPAAGGGHHSGADMTECMIMCAKNGEPLALLTADGKVFRITGGLAANKNEKLIAHVGHTVEITGNVTEKDGKVQIAADTLKMAK